MEDKDIILEETIDQENVNLDDSNDSTEEINTDDQDIEDDEKSLLEADFIDPVEDHGKNNDNSFHLKELRKRYRELKRENYELKKQYPLKAQDVPLISKPTLSECDYDEEEYEKRVLQWHDHQRRQKENDELRRREEDSEKEQWQAKIKRYEDLKKALPFSDKQDVEEIVSDYLTKEQMGAILNICDNPALVLYALSKSTKKLEDLGSTKDYLKFAANVAKIESSIKVTKNTSTKQSSNEDSKFETKNDSVGIKKLIDKALATEGGIYKLLKARPDLTGKIQDYL